MSHLEPCNPKASVMTEKEIMKGNIKSICGITLEAVFKLRVTFTSFAFSNFGDFIKNIWNPLPYFATKFLRGMVS